MPALPMLSKGHGKSKLDNYFQNHVAHGCADKPRLAALLKTEMDSWQVDLAKVPDSDKDLDIPINQNTNPAFLSRIKANAKAHDDLLGTLQDMMDSETPVTEKFLSRVRKARGLVEADAKQWDLQQDKYDREMSVYDEKNEENHKQYHDALARLKMRLAKLREDYNRRYMFEELLTDDSRTRYFLDTDTCIGYHPTQHRWMPEVGAYTDKVTKLKTTGTYMYDFRSNAFQLHIHCNPFDGEVRAIRVKLYSEPRGEYSNSKATNAGVAKRFRETYPPDDSGRWVQV